MKSYKYDEDLLPIIPEFIELKRKELHNIRNMIQSKSYEKLRIMGHKLKGIGMTYGVHFVTEYGRVLSQLSSDESLEHIEALTCLYEDDLDKFNDYIRGCLNEEKNIGG